MNCEVNMDNKKKRLKLYYGLLVTVLCIIGVSYAWFRLYLSQSEDNTIASRTCLDVSITEETSKIALTDAFPITDKAGLKETPFTFTLKNNCNTNTKAYITIDSEYRTSSSVSYLEDTTIKVNLSPKGTTDDTSYILDDLTLTNLENSRKGYIVKTTYLKPNEEKSYDLRIWMDSAVTVDKGLNKTWEGKIVVISEPSKNAAPEGWYDAKKGTLLAALRENNIIGEPLTNPSLEASAHTLDDTESYSVSVSSTTQSYYITYGTGWTANGTGFDLTGTAVTTNTYANSYSDLVGKYIASIYQYTIGSTTAGKIVDTTNLRSIYYIVGATSDSITYKPLSSNRNTTEAVLASTEDDYGTSYYFRGAVKNNYVEFANMCWRIVRITGDGSIKLVLHNVNKNSSQNPCASVNNGNNAAFLPTELMFSRCRDDNSCIGFMNNGIFNSKPFLARKNNNIKASFLGTKPIPDNSSSYAEAHANEENSYILDYLNNWYKDTLYSYDNYLADTIWCNDNKVVTDPAYNPISIDIGLNFGYGDNNNYYSAFKRIVGNVSNASEDYTFTNISPSLKCQNDNDGGKLSKFTANDKTNGNGNLKYKIGLLTADELAFSGLKVDKENNSYYLQENTGGYGYWTMSPAYFFMGVPSLYIINNGLIVASRSNYNGAVRPAISLISQIGILSGNGTSESPYVISASTGFPKA